MDNGIKMKVRILCEGFRHAISSRIVLILGLKEYGDQLNEGQDCYFTLSNGKSFTAFLSLGWCTQSRGKQSGKPLSLSQCYLVFNL